MFTWHQTIFFYMHLLWFVYSALKSDMVTLQFVAHLPSIHKQQYCYHCQYWCGLTDPPPLLSLCCLHLPWSNHPASPPWPLPPGTPRACPSVPALPCCCRVCSWFYFHLVLPFVTCIMRNCFASLNCDTIDFYKAGGGIKWPGC